jgi:hypothetical protein
LLLEGNICTTPASDGMLDAISYRWIFSPYMRELSPVSTTITALEASPLANLFPYLSAFSLSLSFSSISL